MLRLEWDNKKNELLKKARDVCFEDVERAMMEGRIIDIKPHPNQAYPHQEIMVLLLNGYIHYVPFVQYDEKIWLKTIIPSRKLNKIYNKKEK